MELIRTSVEAEKDHHLIDGRTFSEEKILCTIGRDFNKSVANINGLISLLNDLDIADPDYKRAQSYLSVEAHKLQFMVKDICR